MTKHQWKSGFACKVPCETVVERIEVLRADSDDGRIDPARLVQDAKPKESPIHACFEWDNRLAAAKFREDQARRILRSVEIVTVADDGRKSRDIAYVSVCPPFSEGAGYTSTQEAISDPVSRDLVLGIAMSQLEAWRKRWGKLSEFAEVIRAIERAAQRQPEEAA